MKILTSSLITLLVSISLAASAYANITFSINLKQIQEPNPNLRKIRPIGDTQGAEDGGGSVESESLHAIEIGENFFSYETREVKYIYDLGTHKIITISAIDNTFVEGSLFATLIFKMNGFRSRLMLGQTLTTGIVSDSHNSQIFTEHLFSLTHLKEGPKLAMKADNTSVSFSWEGKDLLSYSKEGEEVSRKEKEMFIKFFRYVYKGHPQILDQLSTDNIIPHAITINHYHTSFEKTSLELSSIRTTPSEPYSLDGYLPAPLQDKTTPELTFLLNMKTSRDIKLKEHLAHLLSRVDEEFENGNYLDTFLLYLEYSLCSGLQLPPSFQEQLPKMREDEDVANLQALISGINSEITEELLLQLEELEEKTTVQKHVIKIFQANTQTGLGNIKQAKELFFEVLETDPYITGVYMDLGGIYFRELNPGMAWLCWDTARTIAPSHKVVSEIEAFESRIIENYPEYF